MRALFRVLRSSILYDSDLLPLGLEFIFVAYNKPTIQT